MKIALLILSLVFAFSFASHAQKGNNQIGVAFETGIPVGDFGEINKAGFGGSAKGLFGVGTVGQISLTSGYTSYSTKSKYLQSGEKETIGIVPVLAGYRHNLNSFFIEPQVGVGIYSIHDSGSSDDLNDSKASFTWALGVGYKINNVELGLRYQNGKVNDWISTFEFVGLHLGYNFSLGK
ncbi:MAG TPA: outer membrane beta-barrel protein [Flavisolibacter sp.]|nr:outer membrane beta-barrel protein [Flavisolibacter sp.]